MKRLVCLLLLVLSIYFANAQKVQIFDFFKEEKKYIYFEDSLEQILTIKSIDSNQIQIIYQEFTKSKQLFNIHQNLSWKEYYKDYFVVLNDTITYNLPNEFHFSNQEYVLVIYYDNYKESLLFYKNSSLSRKELKILDY